MDGTPVTFTYAYCNTGVVCNTGVATAEFFHDVGCAVRHNNAGYPRAPHVSVLNSGAYPLATYEASLGDRVVGVRVAYKSVVWEVSMPPVGTGSADDYTLSADDEIIIEASHAIYAADTADGAVTLADGAVTLGGAFVNCVATTVVSTSTVGSGPDTLTVTLANNGSLCELADGTTGTVSVSVTTDLSGAANNLGVGCMIVGDELPPVYTPGAPQCRRRITLPAPTASAEDTRGKHYAVQKRHTSSCTYSAPPTLSINGGGGTGAAAT